MLLLNGRTMNFKIVSELPKDPLCITYSVYFLPNSHVIFGYITRQMIHHAILYVLLFVVLLLKERYWSKLWIIVSKQKEFSLFYTTKESNGATTRVVSQSSSANQDILFQKEQLNQNIIASLFIDCVDKISFYLVRIQTK